MILLFFPPFIRDSQFERVRSGGSNQNLKASEGLKLSLDNKYAALRGD